MPPVNPDPADASCTSPRAAHLVGVAGSGMRALAELLLDCGWRLTGSDLAASDSARLALEARGLVVRPVHRDEHLPADADLLIYSPAVPASNPERAAARARGILELSYTEALGRLTEGRMGVSVAGTHGKSTTTALLGLILTRAGLSPSVVCGGELIDTQCSGWGGAGDLFIVESCEYRRHFLDIRPRHAVLLDIEPDHFDCYPDLDSAVSAYVEFVSRLPSDGLLLFRSDRPAAARAARETRARTRTFAVEADADWSAHRVRTSRQRVSFQVVRAGKPWGGGEFHVAGGHNVANALAAAAMAAELGAGPDAIRDTICTFRGLRRRCEPLGTWRGVVLIDDYAHHPTAVAATLSWARAQYGRRRLWCAFQPHQVSRTRALLEPFAEALQIADQVLVAPVYAAREAEGDEGRALSRLLAERSTALGTPTRCSASLDHLVGTLETETRPGDVLVIMGAGDIERVRHECTRRLQLHHAS